MSTLLLLAAAFAQELEPTRGGLEISMGLRGSLSFVGLSLLTPELAPNFDTRLGVVAMSATNWVSFQDRSTGELVSVHPVVLGGTLYVGGRSDVHADLLRTYGGFELLVGHSFTPYDNLAYGEGNLIGPNLTLGAWGTFGVELFAGEHQAVFIDGGGGFKTYRGLDDRDDPVAVATAWVGSGATLRAGTRFYR